MKNSHHQNISVLKKFVADNDLQDENSSIFFKCFYRIKTAKNFASGEAEAYITFDSFNDEGKVILKSKLEPREFPTILRAKYQDFNIVDNELIVNDVHTLNERIGKYTFKLIALGRIEED